MFRFSFRRNFVSFVLRVLRFVCFWKSSSNSLNFGAEKSWPFKKFRGKTANLTGWKRPRKSKLTVISWLVESPQASTLSFFLAFSFLSVAISTSNLVCVFRIFFNAFFLIFPFQIEENEKYRQKIMKFKSIFVLISVALIQDAVGQSNYASHANNVGYLGEGLPEEATLDGKVSTSYTNPVSLPLPLQHQQSVAAISFDLFDSHSSWRNDAATHIFFS